MARRSAAAAGKQQRQQPFEGAAQAHTKTLAGLHFGDPFGSWGDNALSLLSAQASISAGLASPRKPDGTASAVCAATPRTGDAAAAMHESSQPAQLRQPAQPCDSEGLTADGSGASPEGSASPEPVTSGTLAAPPPDNPDASSPPPAQQPGKKAKRRKRGRSGIYADLIGREVDVPASVFDIQVPDLFYRAIVKRKDAAHPGAVVIRFPEDGSTFWLPADEVWGYIADMEGRRGLGDKSLAGERCAAYAAEVLISLSGAAASSGTNLSPSNGGGTGQAPSQEQRLGGEVESAMATPQRKRARVS